MSILKKILYTLLTLLVLVIIGSYLLPRSVKVERSIKINAPESVIFHLVSNLREFNRWSPWHALDPKTRYTYQGDNGVIGSKMFWSSENPAVGKGSQELTALTENKTVKILLDFGDDGVAQSYYNLHRIDENNTTVSWGFTTDLGMNPISRYAGLFLDDWLGPEYDKGLKLLKKVAELEKEKVDFSELKLKIKQVEPLNIIYIEGEGTTDAKNTAKILTDSFRRLSTYLDLTLASQSSEPLAITTLWDKKNNRWGYKIAIPYTGELTYSGDVEIDPDVENNKLPHYGIKSAQTYAGKVLKVEYVGPYSGMGKIYSKILAYIKANKIEITGDSWEVYISDPQTTAAAELQTDIYFPIK